MNEKKYKDADAERIVRKSAPIRVILGTLTVTSSCILFSMAMRSVKNYPNTYVTNWAKGSLVFSLAFYTLNEALLSFCKYYSIYTNFWINSTISAYVLSKFHYRYLIKTQQMRWHSAILYSHKCFAFLCVFNILTEGWLSFCRYVYFYDEPDVIDFMKTRMSDIKNPVTFEELQSNLITPYHIINSDRKKESLKEFYYKNSILPDGRRKLTIDMYDYYKYQFKS